MPNHHQNIQHNTKFGKINSQVRKYSYGLQPYDAQYFLKIKISIIIEFLMWLKINFFKSRFLSKKNSKKWYF